MTIAEAWLVFFSFRDFFLLSKSPLVIVVCLLLLVRGFVEQEGSALNLFRLNQTKYHFYLFFSEMD